MRLLGWLYRRLWKQVRTGRDVNKARALRWVGVKCRYKVFRPLVVGNKGVMPPTKSCKLINGKLKLRDTHPNLDPPPSLICSRLVNIHSLGPRQSSLFLVQLLMVSRACKQVNVQAGPFSVQLYKLVQADVNAGPRA